MTEGREYHRSVSAGYGQPRLWVNQEKRLLERNRNGLCVPFINGFLPDRFGGHVDPDGAPLIYEQ